MQLSEQELLDCKELFKEQFQQLIDDFTQQLPYADATKRKYTSLLGWLNEYIYGYTENLEVATIKPSEVCSKFYAYAKYDYDFEPNYHKRILQFFLFIDQLGYHNPKVVKHLRNK